jgi:hypothetical protein
MQSRCAVNCGYGVFGSGLLGLPFARSGPLIEVWLQNQVSLTALVEYAKMAPPEFRDQRSPPAEVAKDVQNDPCVMGGSGDCRTVNVS